MRVKSCPEIFDNVGLDVNISLKLSVLHTLDRLVDFAQNSQLDAGKGVLGTLNFGHLDTEVLYKIEINQSEVRNRDFLARHHSEGPSFAGENKFPHVRIVIARCDKPVRNFRHLTLELGLVVGSMGWREVS